VTARPPRLGDGYRSVIIGAMIAAYTYVMNQPGASMTSMLLVAAGLQVIVIVIRRVVAVEAQPFVMYLFELLVDAATVLLFALGVFGGIIRVADVT
jgi:hypothetical protein